MKRKITWLLPCVGRTCISSSKYTERLQNMPPFAASSSSKYLLAYSSHPAKCVGSSSTTFAAKHILHWPGVKLCTKWGLCTNLKAYLLNFFQWPFLRYPRIGAKIEFNNQTNDLLLGQSSVEWDFPALYFWQDGCPPPSLESGKPMCSFQKGAGP